MTSCFARSLRLRPFLTSAFTKGHLVKALADHSVIKGHVNKRLSTQDEIAFWSRRGHLDKTSASSEKNDLSDEESRFVESLSNRLPRLMFLKDRQGNRYSRNEIRRYIDAIKYA